MWEKSLRVFFSDRMKSDPHGSFLHYPDFDFDLAGAEPSMADLVLIRHGQSVWNQQNLFTGWVDCPLSEKGEDEARAAGQSLKGKQDFNLVFTSTLGRAIQTAELLLQEMGVNAQETVRSWEINERYYGRLTGKNKDKAREEFGADQVHIWRRSYDIAAPGAESLADTAARAVPYFVEHILPRVQEGRKVLVSAHGNSLRSIVMHLEGLSQDQVVSLEIATGDPLFYNLDGDKLIRQ